MGRVRIGIDVGGTFTDISVLGEGSGGFAAEKIPSTSDDPSRAVVEGMLLALRPIGTPLEDVSFFAHGSTVATNALIQRTGSKTGLITTSGFRDVLEIGRQSRPHLYDLQADKPEPLVSRDLRLEVRERIYADGRILVPLSIEDVETAVAKLRKANVGAIAVCFLHSYRNPAHERATKAIVQESIPDAYISASHEVLPEFREFERVNTTVINAYLGPVVSGYVHNLKERLVRIGVNCGIYMNQSNGGVISLDLAARHTCRTVLSGPSSGVVGACHVARQAGFDSLITFDMGGTSTDASLVMHGTPGLVNQRTVAGYPVKTPMIDIHTIGAGGGSIARTDIGGLLKVGPQSAGADPGPACYDKGGEYATVTDANVLLGVLNPRHLLGGRMKIDPDRSREVVRTLAAGLGLDELQTAQGIIRVVVANMARAVRVISVQRGYDPRDYMLMPFGGAGPLHSGWLMRELRMRHALIPRHPGLLCAFGLLVTDMRSDFVLTRILPSEKADLEEINTIYTQLEHQALNWFCVEGVPAEQRVVRRSVDMRYVGQNYELSVPVPVGRLDRNSIKAVGTEFLRIHDQAYGHAVPGEPTEFITFRVEAVGIISKPSIAEYPDSGPEACVESLLGCRRIFLGSGWVETPVYARELLLPGNVVTGPAVIEQMDATTLILPGQRSSVDRFLNMLIEDHEQIDGRGQ